MFLLNVFHSFKSFVCIAFFCSICICVEFFFLMQNYSFVFASHFCKVGGGITPVHPTRQRGLLWVAFCRAFQLEDPGEAFLR